MLSCHPTLDVLVDFSSGSLSLAHALGVSVHLDQCPKCREQIRRLNMVGAELFISQTDSASPHHMAQLKSNLMAAIGHSQTDTAAQQTAQEGLPNIPPSLRRWVPNGFNALNWIYLTPYFKLATLFDEAGGAQVALAHIKAGARFPRHTHTGDEMTIVLKGAFSDEEGLYQKGDFIHRNQSHKHQPRATKDEECVCLIILDSPIEFTGWMTRLLNPIMRYFHPNNALNGS